jgi:protein gp37
MSETSSIEWTDATWNPVRGCTKISPGCKHCYAETFAERFRGVPNHPYEQGFDLRLVPEKLNEPLKWKVSKKIFVNSMSDLFHPRVPVEYIEEVARVMIKGDWHQYQVLTKRAERLKTLLNTNLRFATSSQHIWWGVSVENKKHGLPRIEELRNTPASIKFLSIEPLLEDLGDVDFSGIDWVIVGGESGRGARKMEKSWVQGILRQCRTQKVRFFFKQWGGLNKKAAGRTLNGRIYDELPILQ